MKSFSCLFFLLFTTFSFSQTKKISLEELWSGKFRENQVDTFYPMKEDNYSLLSYNSKEKSTQIDTYFYASLKKKETILNSNDFPEIAYFDDYQFNQDETKVLLSTQTQYIYRHSTKSIYYLYDFSTKKMALVDESPIQEPSFSPNNNQLAYVKNNNIYLKNLNDFTTEQITSDGFKNTIINGISDWVYEEEFGFVKAYEWNSTGTALAYLKFDETQVPEFSMISYQKELYPKVITFKYPKAGEKNSIVTTYVYAIDNKSTTQISTLGEYEYIPKINWTNDENILSICKLNRQQNNLQLIAFDVKDNSTTTLYEEKQATYVDFEKMGNLFFLKDNSFIWTSEKSGYNHLYHYKSNGKLIQPLTTGNWEVTQTYGFDEINQLFYYQSTELGSTKRTIYSVNLKGKKNKIGLSNGFNDAQFSKDKTYAVISHSDTSTPTTHSLYKKNTKISVIEDNQKLKETLKEYQLSKKEFSVLKTSNGNFNMWTLKPVDFDASKKYPLLMVQYSGPGSQEVQQKWNKPNDYWFQTLADKGFIIACIDGRGTGFKGQDFKNCTYKDLGKLETIDQIESAKALGKLPYIDKDRIGIWGWSFGGFVATNALLKGADVFKAAIAVAPVTSWRFYDTIYTERFLQTPEENPNGYDENSPIYFANQLKGKYLLIHGTTDDNVHIQNTYQMTNALVLANKDFEQFIYPDRNHGIYHGKNTRLHLYLKMTQFLEKNLLK